MGEFAAWAAVVIAGVGVWVAWRQLDNLNSTLKINSDALRINGLMAVLQMEADMNARKEKKVEVSGRIREESLKKDEANQELIELLNQQLNAAIENYLNSVDRLAFCILKGYLTDRDWRTEYRQAIANDVQTYEDRLGPSTVHRNILDLHHKWQRE